MKNKFLSIKTQLVVTFLTISFIVVASVSYFSFTTNIKQQKNSFIQNSIIQANLLADFNVSSLVFLDMDGTKDNLEKLKNNEDILQVIIYDTDKNIFAQYNPNNLETPINNDFTDIRNIDKIKNNLNSDNLKIIVPIQHKDKIYGTLYLEKSTKFINELISKLLMDILKFTLILLIIIYIISLFLSEYLLKPILFLAEISHKISTSRDYSTRVNYDSKNEIGILYHAFNSLLEDTQKLTDDLENQVDIRTKELQKSLNDLQDAQQKLIESEKMSALGNLVSGVAHEVNTPLGNALTSSSIITKETSELIEQMTNGTLKRSSMENKLEVLNQASNLLQKTLEYASNLIRSFKQISVDQITDDIRAFNLKNYIEEIFLTNGNKLKVSAVQKEIICEEEIIIETSAGIIAQIFNNFIQNSILHGFDNFKGEAKIVVKLEKVKNNLIITYKDNGNGIDESVKDKIFEPFVTTKRNAGGTGLGLNIVYNLIYQKLKGNLQVISEKNKGVQFIIRIPMNNLNEEKV